MSKLDEAAVQKNGFLSLSQKKKSKQYWSFKRAAGKAANKATKEE